MLGPPSTEFGQRVDPNFAKFVQGRPELRQIWPAMGRRVANFGRNWPRSSTSMGRFHSGTLSILWILALVVACLQVRCRGSLRFLPSQASSLQVRRFTPASHKILIHTFWRHRRPGGQPDLFDILRPLLDFPTDRKNTDAPTICGLRARRSSRVAAPVAARAHLLLRPAGGRSWRSRAGAQEGLGGLEFVPAGGRSKWSRVGMRAAYLLGHSRDPRGELSARGLDVADELEDHVGGSRGARLSRACQCVCVCMVERSQDRSHSASMRPQHMCVCVCQRVSPPLVPQEEQHGRLHIEWALGAQSQTTPASCLRRSKPTLFATIAASSMESAPGTLAT